MWSRFFDLNSIRNKAETNWNDNQSSQSSWSDDWSNRIGSSVRYDENVRFRNLRNHHHHHQHDRIENLDDFHSKHGFDIQSDDQHIYHIYVSNFFDFLREERKMEIHLRITRKKSMFYCETLTESSSLKEKIIDQKKLCRTYLNKRRDLQRKLNVTATWNWIW